MNAKFVIITSLNTVTPKSEVVSVKEIKYTKTEARQSQRSRAKLCYLVNNNNNNNNNNSRDNVYGAVIMTKVIARVHPGHLMNVD